MSEPSDNQPPKETDYGAVKTIRLRIEDVERLRALTDALGASEAAVIRMGLRELAKREGLE